MTKAPLLPLAYALIHVAKSKGLRRRDRVSRIVIRVVPHDGTFLPEVILGHGDGPSCRVEINVERGEVGHTQRFGTFVGDLLMMAERAGDAVTTDCVEMAAGPGEHIETLIHNDPDAAEAAKFLLTHEFGDTPH
jgi:hypothetical protein